MRRVIVLPWARVAARIAGVDIAGERIRFIGRDPVYDWWLLRVRQRKWEPEVVECFRAAIRPGSTVLDVGAWIGVYTLLASRLVGTQGHVYAFEPDPVARESLSRNLRLNAVNNVAVVPLAVSDNRNQLFLPQGDLGTSETTLTSAGDRPIPATTLDGFCARHNITPDVIKMDIEGGETAALSPAAAGNAIRDAHTVIVEVHATMGADRESLERFFADAGKRPHDVDRRPDGNFNVAFVG